MSGDRVKTPRNWLEAAQAFVRMPAVRVCLMESAAAENDPFYGRLIREFHAFARARHRKFPLVRNLSHGVALCRLPRTMEAYLARIEPAGRRNIRKAQRLGYTFRRIVFNDHLDDVRAIRQSAVCRQGEMPAELLAGDVKPCQDPPSRTDVHDYVYYGVFREGRLVAYAACFVCGEVVMLEHILGHDAYLADGIVPLLVTEIAGDVMARYPRVKYYTYGTFFGGGVSMRRFKKKFGFLPCRVTWILDGAGA